MNEKQVRIIYMGTPEFAIPPLKSLLEKGYNVVAVVTAPDKQAGRGQKMQFPPVKAFALDHQLKLFQPEKLREESFVSNLKSLKPDLQVVVAFRMLPEVVWSIPSIGTFNLHASLLPNYRGAAPINRVIINGEKETGLTTFFIDQHIDSGNILLQRKVPVYDTDNAGTLHDRLMLEGAGLVIETVDRLVAGEIRAVSQDTLMNDSDGIRTAPKITREDCRINWDRPGKAVHNFIRGMTPYPGPYAYLSNEKGEHILFKFYETSFIPKAHRADPGTVSTDNRTYLHIAVNDGWIAVHTLQQSGKRVMPLEEFLRGFSFKPFLPRFF